MSLLRLAFGGLIVLNVLIFTHLNSLSFTTSFITRQPSPFSAYTDEPIALSMVMFGNTSALEGVIAIKSALMHVSKPTEFHLIVSPDAIPILEERLHLVSRPAYNVRVFYYTLTEQQIRARANRAGVDTKYAAGLGGLVKTFMHEIIPASKVIFFDTDMMFVTDPFLLWRRFAQFTPSQIMSLPDYGEQSGPMEICTCIMLLNLEEMRSPTTPFMPSTRFPASVQPLGSQDVFLKNGVDPLDPAFGDQGLYWAVWEEYPDKVAHLPLGWDTSHCQFSFGMTLEGSDMMSEAEHISSQIRTQEAQEEFAQLFPGILHFNCQPDAAVVWDEPENWERPRWAAFVNLILDYKWVWLNKGDRSTSLKTSVVRDVKFLDERALPAPVGLASS